jgi:hypothetical protein
MELRRDRLRASDQAKASGDFRDIRVVEVPNMVALVSRNYAANRSVADQAVVNRLKPCGAQNGRQARKANGGAILS